MRVLISGVIVVMVGGFLLLLNSMGAFVPVTVQEKAMGPYVLVYEVHAGDFKGIKPVIQRVCSALKNEQNIETARTFGLYYDDPKTTPKKKLRSLVGCVVEPKDQERTASLPKKFQMMTLPAFQATVVEFPYRSELSMLVGVHKVYPAMKKFRKQRGYPETSALEVYDLANHKIEYLMGIPLTPP